jgi:hypothetical protein
MIGRLVVEAGWKYSFIVVSVAGGQCVVVRGAQLYIARIARGRSRRYPG